MRLVLALCATLACAQAAAAQTVEDRYGPPRPRAHPAGGAQQVASLTPYQGRLLSWSSKGSAPAPVEAAPAPQPEPVRAPVAQPRPAPVAAAPVVPAPQPAPIAAAPVPQPIHAPQPAPQPAVARLPDSLYAPPPPVAQPAPHRVVAAAAAPPATAPVGSRTHFYSVHREYGLAPDAIPAPSQANRYVLIGPPDGAEGPRKTDDAEDRPF